MRRRKILLVLLVILACVCAARPSSFEPARGAKRQVKWNRKTIQIAISSSLNSDNTSIRPQSDVAGAIHRALATWSAVTNLEFVEVPSEAQSVSAPSRGDGINLITIAATPQNLAFFRNDNSPARTRVFYDNETGEITEADIVLNPYPYAVDGTPLDFSTDGSVGTYDLQSTLTHELGHLLGLNHSNVLGATMNATQALNGIFGLPAFSGRSLSESDRVAVSSIYLPRNDTGAVEGRILNTRQGNLVAASSASVWIEDALTGRVVGSGLADANGDFKIGGVAPGTYRLMAQYPDSITLRETLSLDTDAHPAADGFRSVEIASQLRVVPHKSTTVSYVLVPPQNSAALLRPRFIGTNGELSTVSLPTTPGTKVTVYVSGEGVDQVTANGLLISSPYLTVDPASLTAHQYANSSRVLSFDVTIATDAPDGDYSVRLQANSGEIAYLVGALTVARRQ